MAQPTLRKSPRLAPLAWPVLAALVLGLALGCSQPKPKVEIGQIGSLVVEAADNGDIVFTATNDIEVFSVALPGEKREEAVDKLSRVFTEGRDWCEAHRTREVPVWSYPDVKARATYIEDGSTFFFIIALGQMDNNRKSATVSLSEERAEKLLDLLAQAPELRKARIQGF